MNKSVRRLVQDKETEPTEKSLQELIRVFRTNEKIEHVLLKVVAINVLYHARVLDVDLHPLAVHIQKIQNLDDKLKSGQLQVVDEIWRSEGTRRHYFSFATKLCNWHNQDAYAIYDAYVWAALCAYRKQKSGFAFKDADCKDYPGFHAVVKRFQVVYNLGDCSLKQIDKSLWIVGNELTEARRRNKRRTKHQSSGP